MTDELVGIDHSQAILDQVKKNLENKGVIYLGPAEGMERLHRFQGLGNKYVSKVYVSKLDEAPTEEQASSLIAQYVGDVEKGLRERKSE